MSFNEHNGHPAPISTIPILFSYSYMIVTEKITNNYHGWRHFLDDQRYLTPTLLTPDEQHRSEVDCTSHMHTCICEQVAGWELETTRSSPCMDSCMFNAITPITQQRAPFIYSITSLPSLPNPMPIVCFDSLYTSKTISKIHSPLHRLLNQSQCDIPLIPLHPLHPNPLHLLPHT